MRKQIYSQRRGKGKRRAWCEIRSQWDNGSGDVAKKNLHSWLSMDIAMKNEDTMCTVCKLSSAAVVRRNALKTRATLEWNKNWLRVHLVLRFHGCLIIITIKQWRIRCDAPVRLQFFFSLLSHNDQQARNASLQFSCHELFSPASIAYRFSFQARYASQ